MTDVYEVVLDSSSSTGMSPGDCYSAVSLFQRRLCLQLRFGYLSLPGKTAKKAHSTSRHQLTEIQRFLVLKGRYEEAERVLQRMHGDHEDSTFYLRELHQMKAQIELESEETMGIKAILTKRSLRKRFILVLGYAFSCM